jgi:hypothetical protein
MVLPIINLFRTLEEAMYFDNSQINRFYIFDGVQLLPNNPTKYIQVTDTPDGMNLEDWTVRVKDLNGNDLGDITDSFLVEDPTNSINGNPQIVWSLINIPIDFGWKMIYLEITQALGDTFFSQPFKITNINKEKTSQYHYKEDRNDIYQSIGFCTWFRRPKQYTDLTTYYRVSEKRSVTAKLKVNKTEIHETEEMPISLLMRLLDVLSCPYCYINEYRVSLYSTMKIPDTQAQENFGYAEFEISADRKDLYSLQIPETLNGDFDPNDFYGDDFNLFN